MDRVIPKKKWTTKRMLTIGGGGALVLLIAASFYFTTGKSKLNVDTERITISEVKNGTFQEFIPVNGVVLPITTIYLDATEGGRVEEKYVEDGTTMKAGDPILKLVNTDLELDLANRQTAVFDVLTQMQNTKNLSDQNTIRELNQMADVTNAYEEAKRIYQLDSQLYVKQAIGSQEYQSAKNNYDYQTKRKKLSQQTLL